MIDSIDFINKHYSETFKKYGATSKGVYCGSNLDVNVRYQKMIKVLDSDYEKPAGKPSLLDLGCGWGGLYKYCLLNDFNVDYTGIDVVESMIEYGKKKFINGNFFVGNALDLDFKNKFDYVVGNGLLPLIINNNIPQTEKYVKKLIRKMFEICKYGIAFNLMSSRVNYMADKLYYTSPVEILNFCLDEISPRVRLDHSYTCLNRKSGKLFEYTVYIYKDQD